MRSGTRAGRLIALAFVPVYVPKQRLRLERKKKVPLVDHRLARVGCVPRNAAQIFQCPGDSRNKHK